MISALACSFACTYPSGYKYFHGFGIIPWTYFGKRFPYRSPIKQGVKQSRDIENKFTRMRARNFLCPLFSNGRDGSRQ